MRIKKFGGISKGLALAGLIALAACVNQATIPTSTGMQTVTIPTPKTPLQAAYEFDGAYTAALIVIDQYKNSAVADPAVVAKARAAVDRAEPAVVDLEKLVGAINPNESAIDQALKVAVVAAQGVLDISAAIKGGK